MISGITAGWSATQTVGIIIIIIIIIIESYRVQTPAGYSPICLTPHITIHMSVCFNFLDMNK